MSGGVRNLRAMFEQQNQQQEQPSPNARGRSPASEINNDNGSRQGSKVRASFFPVEASKPRNQTPDTNASTSRRRESNPTSEERHAGNEEILNIQERAKQELEAVQADVEVETSAVTKLNTTPTLTNELQPASAPVSQQTPGDKTTDAGRSAVVPAEDLVEPSGSKPEVQHELEQEMERKATERKKAAALLQHSPDPFVTKTPNNALGKNINGMAKNAESPTPINSKKSAAVPESSSLVKAISPPTSQPSLHISPPPEQVMQNLAANLRTPIQSSKQSGKAPAKERSPMPHTPTHAPKSVTPRTAPKLVVRSTPSYERPPAPEPGQTCPIDLPGPLAPTPTTAGKKTLASPMTNDSPVSRTQGTSQGGRLSVASRRGGTVTTGGFVKPRPKSPTRPVKLPAHLVAPTASSAAKHGNTPPQTEKTLMRRASTISNASNFSRSAQGLVGRRPSTRPPTKQQILRPAAPSGQNPPVPRVPDDSFLARMMRPTASSASKVKDGGLVKGKEIARPKAKAAARPKTNGVALTNGTTPLGEHDGGIEREQKIEIEADETATAEEATGPIEDGFAD